MLRLEKSICGCSLTTGALILGWLQLISAAFSSCSSLATYLKIDDQMNATKSDISIETKRELVTYIESYALTIFLSSLVTVVISIFFLTGVYKRISCLMLPSIILGAIGLSFAAILGIVVFFAAFLKPVMFAGFLVIALEIALMGYLWLIIYSCYLEIKDGERTLASFPIHKI